MGKKLWVPVVSGPLAPYAAGFGSWLRSRAYSPSAAGRQAVSVRPGQPLARARGTGHGELTDKQAGRLLRAAMQQVS